MSLNQFERIALENEKRALQSEMNLVTQQIASRGGGLNSQTWDLQTRRQSIDAQIQAVDARLRHN